MKYSLCTSETQHLMFLIVRAVCEISPQSWPSGLAALHPSFWESLCMAAYLERTRLWCSSWGQVLSSDGSERETKQTRCKDQCTHVWKLMIIQIAGTGGLSCAGINIYFYPQSSITGCELQPDSSDNWRGVCQIAVVGFRTTVCTFSFISVTMEGKQPGLHQSKICLIRFLWAIQKCTLDHSLTVHSHQRFEGHQASCSSGFTVVFNFVFLPTM